MFRSAVAVVGALKSEIKARKAHTKKYNKNKVAKSLNYRDLATFFLNFPGNES